MKKHCSKIKISDHALIRYIERIEGVDLTPIRKAILSKELERKALNVDETGVIVLKTHKAILRENIITTILTPQQKTGQYTKRKRYGKPIRKDYNRKANIANSSRNSNNEKL